MVYLPNLWVAISLFILMGISAVASFVSIQTVLQMSVANKFMGRVFGSFTMTVALLGVMGTLLAGVLGDIFGSVVLLNVSGLIYIVAAVVALYRLPARIPGLAQAETPNVTGAPELEPATVEQPVAVR